MTDLIERLRDMVRHPNVHFHYSDDVETVRAAIAALTPPAAEGEVTQAAFTEGLWAGWRSGLAGEQMDDGYAALSWLASDANSHLAHAAPKVAGMDGIAWQPIETAPKDGSYVMLYDDGAMRLGMWLSTGWEPAEIPIYVDSVGNRVVSRELGMIRPGCFLELSGFVYEPTHWMPLPAAPSAPGSGEG